MPYSYIVIINVSYMNYKELKCLSFIEHYVPVFVPVTSIHRKRDSDIFEFNVPEI